MAARIHGPFSVVALNANGILRLYYQLSKQLLDQPSLKYSLDV
jgi:hypothetical protein